MACLFHRILTFKEAFRFQPISITKADGTDATKIYHYSWSTDGVCWTNWVTYDQYLMLAKNIESDFYMRILIFDTIGEVRLNGCLTTCYNICIEQQNFISTACSDPNLFQPYIGLDCALLLQQQLSDAVICMLGIPIYYFRCDPVAESADFTFKEFTLHNVVACKQLKLMVQDGQMPSSNPKLNEFDFDWEVDWETELSKTQFAAAFGDTAIPKQRDFLYIPMMKRMWQVNSAYDEKQEGLLWRSTTWKLALVKYNEATNVDLDGFEQMVDGFVNKTWENTFQEIEKKEQERQTGYNQVQAPKFAANNLFDVFMEDNTRQALTKQDVSVLDKIYCHNNNVVARNIYKFKNENGCVVYQNGICGDSGTITMMIETPGHLHGEVSRNIAEFGPIEFEVGYNDKKQQFYFGIDNMIAKLNQFSTYMIIYRWNRATYTRELSIYAHTHRTDLPIYVLKPEMFWFDYDNPVAELTEAYNNDYALCEPQVCQIHTWPLLCTNIKLYNRYLDKETAIKEATKYTTTNELCIFNDVARPINSGTGFTIK